MENLIATGTEAHVYRGPLFNQVTKSYIYHDKEKGISAAYSEFIKLKKLQVLNRRHIKIPAPYFVNETNPASLVMEFCEGVGLITFISTVLLTDDQLDLISKSVYCFSNRYTSILNEHCRDLEPGNIIFCDKTETLSFVDFSVGACNKPNFNTIDDLSLISMAEFISALIFTSCRPKNICLNILRTNSIKLIDKIFALILMDKGRFNDGFVLQIKLSFLVRLSGLGILRYLWFNLFSFYFFYKLKRTIAGAC